MENVPAARIVFAEFIKAGFTSAQTCGPISSMEIESDFNPRAVGDHGQAVNLCQWHGDRVYDIERGCGINLRTCGLEDAVRACIWEMEHLETEAYNAVKRSKTAAQSAAAFVEFYERPANLHQQIAIRVAAAERWAKVFGV